MEKGAKETFEGPSRVTQKGFHAIGFVFGDPECATWMLVGTTARDDGRFCKDGVYVREVYDNDRKLSALWQKYSKIEEYDTEVPCVFWAA